MINHKLVLKGTGKISLHERFTQLSKIQVPSEPAWNGHSREPEVTFIGSSSGVSRYGRGSSTSFSRDLSPQLPSLRRPRSVPTTQTRDTSVQPEQRLYRPSAAVTAARHLKRRSIHQRLGVRARLSLPRYTPGAGLRSWGSEDSVISNNAGVRRWVMCGNMTSFFYFTVSEGGLGSGEEVDT